MVGNLVVINGSHYFTNKKGKLLSDMKVFDLRNNQGDENEIIKICFASLLHNGGASVPEGKYFVGKDGIFFCVSEYTTRSVENSKWEAHKEYADLQVVLNGEEHILISDIDTMETGAYHEESDYLECKGEPMHTLKLNENICVLLMPEDAHMPGISVGNNPKAVKKVVFKIPIGYFENGY